ncbi:MAG: hypothetical protein V4667_06125 [Bacteroidota bacterium]
MVEQLAILKQIDLPEALIALRNDDIIEVIFKDDVVLDIALQNKLLKSYLEICDNKQMCFIFKAMDNVTITKEARDNATNLEDASPLKASALITDSLAYKLIGQFYLKVNKPKRPFNIFKTELDAIEWLKQFI